MAVQNKDCLPVSWFHSKNFKLDQVVQREHCEVQEGGNENSNMTKGDVFVVLEEVLILCFYFLCG